MVCADGSRVAVGQITVGTGHAPLNMRASHAAEHYDNTGAAVADVAVGNDKFGTWVALGRPFVTYKAAVTLDGRVTVPGSRWVSGEASRRHVHELRASGRLSGDWRRIGGSLRLVGLLAVNVPGFPIPTPRARVASGAPTALVAAGVGSALGPGRLKVANELTDEQQDQLAMRRVLKMLGSRVHANVETLEGV